MSWSQSCATSSLDTWCLMISQNPLPFIHGLFRIPSQFSISAWSAICFITFVMPSKKSMLGKAWSMYPDLHDDVSRLLEEDDLSFDFHDYDDSGSATKDYDTNIMGRFICGNRACGSNGWSSKKIAITIRMYNGARYNARVYNQRCRACNSLGKPRLDVGSYAERVAYRLKKWRGKNPNRPIYSSKSKGPHEKNLCEGCKNGHCRELALEWLGWQCKSAVSSEVAWFLTAFQYSSSVTATCAGAASQTQIQLRVRQVRLIIPRRVVATKRRRERGEFGVAAREW